MPEFGGWLIAGSGVMKTDGAAAKVGGASKRLGVERFRGAQLTETIWLSTDLQEVGAMSVLINLSALLDDAKGFELARQTHWPQGFHCPKCGAEHVVRNGHDDTQPHRQRYLCNDCQFRFDDLSDTALAGHH